MSRLNCVAVLCMSSKSYMLDTSHFERSRLNCIAVLCMPSKSYVLDTSHFEMLRLNCCILYDVSWNKFGELFPNLFLQLALLQLSRCCQSSCAELIFSADSLPEWTPIVRDQPCWDLLSSASTPLVHVFFDVLCYFCLSLLSYCIFYLFNWQVMSCQSVMCRLLKPFWRQFELKLHKTFTSFARARLPRGSKFTLSIVEFEHILPLR